ncbi:unnamed protein product [Hydatigera taeniaeformis]|uniref:Ig-like domain-containing protein n=1 Tax=Hydatigena taeniaeformis TaxID=6205 RepID=A0A0R3WJE0_HYDTA|nr:unnamed protein product [Hydatigera taeniaeformis]
MANHFLLVVGLALLVRGSVYDEFKQWDPIHWIVKSTDHVELPCYHPRYYPFNKLDSILKVLWILPEHTSYMRMGPGSASEGWKVMGKDKKYKIVIEKSKMSQPETVNGMYLCAALAEVALSTGGNKTYYWPFTYAWVSVLVALAAVGLFSSAVHFRYKGGPKASSDAENFDTSSDTLTEDDNQSYSMKAEKTRGFELSLEINLFWNSLCISVNKRHRSRLQQTHSLFVSFSLQIDRLNRLKMAYFLLLAITMAALVSADIHDDFPQWDRIPWVVRSTDTITLNCTHPVHYPFTDIQSALSVQWILPKAASYRHLKEGETEEGWHVTTKERNYQLKINKAIMNVPDAVNGMYVCAALAPASKNPDGSAATYAWYYLRWGVGLYTNVPAMNEGTTAQKYYWPFTYAWVSILVGLTIIALFSLTMHFKYKGGPVKGDDDEGVGEDGLSLDDEDEKTSTIGKKDRNLKIDDDDIDGRL